MFGQNAVEHGEIDHAGVRRIGCPADGDLDSIQVTMILRRPTVRKAVSCVQCNRTGERTARPVRHQWMPRPTRISGVIVYCDATPVGLTAFGLAVVPGCFAGSRA